MTKLQHGVERSISAKESGRSKSNETTIIDFDEVNRSSFRRERRHSDVDNESNGAWRPKGSDVSVKGRSIGGMVYVGPAPLVGQNRQKSRAHIDPSLSVASRAANPENPGMPYWPCYSEISPTARAAYLDWLSGGRQDPKYDPGFLFLYFYGLERRYFLDAPSNAEKRQIIDEVARLEQVYDGVQSVRQYLGTFLDVTKMECQDRGVQIPPLAPGYDLPLSARAYLGLTMKSGRPLCAEWLLGWWYCWQDRRMRTPASRCKIEFEAMFRHFFTSRYPNGMAVKPPKKRLNARYAAASNEFVIDITTNHDGSDLPDVCALTRPLKLAQEIADEAMATLDKYSRYIGRSPDGAGSLEARALLPKVLWGNTQSDEIDALATWAEMIVAKNGTLPVLDLLLKLEGGIPEKVGKKQLTGAADALASLGYGMAPDPRYGLRAPKIDEPVVLFRLPHGPAELDVVSDTYRAALLQIGLATFIAQSDGQVVTSEEASLAQHIVESADLSPTELTRLKANLVWLMAVPPDLQLFRAKLKAADISQSDAIRRTVTMMAMADDVIRPEEVRGVEWIYKTMGLDAGLVYSDLHGGVPLDEPVVVRQAQPESGGEEIRPEALSAKIGLNTERIAAIRHETNRASLVLGDIFSDDEPEEELDEICTDVFDGLDSQHTRFLIELLACNTWTEQDFEVLAARHDVFPSGALETINEWCCERYEDVLIDEYDGYEINTELAEQMKTTA